MIDDRAGAACQGWTLGSLPSPCPSPPAAQAISVPTWWAGREPQPRGRGALCSARASPGFVLHQLGLFLPWPRGLLLGVDEAWLRPWFASFIFSRKCSIKRVIYKTDRPEGPWAGEGRGPQAPPFQPTVSPGARRGGVERTRIHTPGDVGRPTAATGGHLHYRNQLTVDSHPICKVPSRQLLNWHLIESLGSPA